jgi:hypothetical protein
VCQLCCAVVGVLFLHGRRTVQCCMSARRPARAAARQLATGTGPGGSLDSFLGTCNWRPEYNRAYRAERLFWERRLLGVKVSSISGRAPIKPDLICVRSLPVVAALPEWLVCLSTPRNMKPARVRIQPQPPFRSSKSLYKMPNADSRKTKSRLRRSAA